MGIFNFLGRICSGIRLISRTVPDDLSSDFPYSKCNRREATIEEIDHEKPSAQPNELSEAQNNDQIVKKNESGLEPDLSLLEVQRKIEAETQDVVVDSIPVEVQLKSEAEVENDEKIQDLVELNAHPSEVIEAKITQNKSDKYECNLVDDHEIKLRPTKHFSSIKSVE
jgi:hypothetical protein